MTAEPPAADPPAVPAHGTGRGPAQTLEPLDVDGVSATTVGTAVWATGFLLLLMVGVRFDDPNGWWLWVCLAGTALGLPMMVYTRRRRAVYRAAGRTSR